MSISWYHLDWDRLGPSGWIVKAHGQGLLEAQRGAASIAGRQDRHICIPRTGTRSGAVNGAEKLQKKR